MQIPLSDVTYYVHTWGDKTHTPLFLLHGFTGSGKTWSTVAETLASEYYIAAPDLLGHGMSSSPKEPSRYTFQHIRQDLSDLADVIFAAQPFHLLGYSMGGRIALDFALTHQSRLRSLILESASDGILDDNEREARRKSDNALAESILSQGIKSFIDSWEALPLWHTQASLSATTRQQQREQRLQNNPIGLANSLRGHGTGAQPSYRPLLAQLDLPVLLLSGALDTKFVAAAEAMRVHIRKARHVSIPDVGHNVHLENPVGFSKTILEFLQEWR